VLQKNFRHLAYLRNNALNDKCNYEQQDVKHYKDFLNTLVSDKCADVLTEEFISRHGLDPESFFSVLDGLHLNPRLLGYRGKMSSNTLYRMYLVTNANRKVKRIFECTN